MKPNKVNKQLPRTPNKRALIIVPTYNESKNITRLLKTIFALTEANKTEWDLHVLVRDDTSPDGTGEIVQSLQKNNYKDKLFLSSGRKEGLGKALQLAFDEALDLEYPIIITMDADFSHDPGDIPKLLEAIDDGADVAIGSRYVDGGLIPGNWPISLIVRTRVASQVARFVGGINPSLRELTTNFRAMKREVLQQIGYNQVKANGYGFQIFLANAFSLYDFKLKEVPISFYSRADGSSKAKLSDVIEFFKIAYSLNDDSPGKQVFRFVAVGISGTIVNLFSLWAIRNISGSEAIVISIAAIQISILWNFILHNVFTFKRYKHEIRQHKTDLLLHLKNFFKYQVASAFTQAIIFTSFILFFNLGVFYLLAQAIGIAFAFLVNYYLSSTYIWTISRKYV